MLANQYSVEKDSVSSNETMINNNNDQLTTTSTYRD